ncbi:hypothetical protein LMG22037_05795 [Paraburkholderia phenoliruptrix]|uniref:Uncharacterized protein n=1 Tax=Paraburkholderia phenoliruptrix TaxID=252970 RepID=A0A6J5CER5_9BURK|nr:hypothetical protein [Paraburkholderia phenoliruptrix]CAB3733404.1 hypothetical protein LMG22037_05795 [Paraburkholderia phenoliruptrix]
MCYKDPEKGIALVLECIGHLKSAHGHSPLEDFDHFCAYSGLSEDEVGRLPFLWTKYGFLSAWKPAAATADDSGAPPAESHRQEDDEVAVAAFKLQVGMLLRDLPPGTVAELDGLSIAWWNGKDVVFAYLRDDDTEKVEEEFDLGDCEWQDRRAALEAWLKEPRYGLRAEVRDWVSRPRQ